MTPTFRARVIHYVTVERMSFNAAIAQAHADQKSGDRTLGG
jgi:hypothetical protein